MEARGLKPGFKNRFRVILGLIGFTEGLGFRGC